MSMNLRTVRFIPAFAFLALFCACAAWAEAGTEIGLIPRQDLFGNPEKTNLQISPDGKWLAWLAPLSGVLNVFAAPVSDPDAAVPITADKRRGIHSYHWTYDGIHLVYLQDEGGDENWHVYAANVLSRTARDLTPYRGVRALFAGKSRKMRGEVLVSLNKRDPQYADLYRANLETGDLLRVAENPGFSRIVADGSFTPRLAWKATPEGGAEILRANGRGFEPWLEIAPEDAANAKLEGLSSDGESLLMLDSRGRNTAALARIDLLSGEETLIAEDPRADIGAELAGWNVKEPMAYTVTYARTEHIALSPGLQLDFDFLNAKFGSEWTIDSRTEDNRLWTVTVRSDLHPAASYLYRRNGMTLTKLFDGRPKLIGAPLAQMHTVIVKSRDGLDLVSYLTLPKGSDDGHAGRPGKPLPMVLTVHGGPWTRDVFGYHSRHQWLANRGYAVLSVNFRGSAGFGKAFMNAGNKEWGRKMDDDLLDALDWAIGEKIADPRRIAIVGASYGGYATLAGMTRNPDRYACGVELAGPSELELFIKEMPPYWASGRPKFVKAIGDPATEEGRELLKERSPLYQADRIEKPLLIAQGENDPRVKREQPDRIVETLRAKGIPVTYLLYRGEGHGFAEPENNVSFAAVAESFLAKCLGGRAAPIEPADLKGASIEIPVGADLIEGYAAAKDAAAQ